ncbi:WXG100 family type VII secretion target [Paenibacillus sp. NPDC058910]|uniref:WXG100 family type VII secretion target n=1 Tax=unclassified Paenibacillus TaxID=185978 RepID=UPI003685F764
MPRILVPPEVLIRVSEEATRAAEELETTKNRLDQQISYMMSSWEGTTRSRFFEDFQHAHGEMNKTIEHLRIIGQELKTIAFRFISADMHEDLMIAAAAASAANEPKTFWDQAGDFWQGLQTGAKSVANSVKDTATSLVEDPLGTAKDMAYNATIGTAEEIIDTAVWGGKMIFDADTREKFAADIEDSGGASNYMGQQAAMILAGLATRRIGVKTHPHLKHDSGGDGGKVVVGKTNLTEPSLPEGSKPKGKYTQGDSHGVKKENETADLLADRGYNIEMLDEVNGGNGHGIKETSNPDFLIEGKVFDCYAPTQDTNVDNVLRNIRTKTKAQADRIVLNLDNFAVEKISEITEGILRKANPNGDLKSLKELIIVNDGKITRVFGG